MLLRFIFCFYILFSLDEFFWFCLLHQFTTLYLIDLLTNQLFLSLCHCTITDIDQIYQHFNTLAASYHIPAKWPEGFLLIVACFNIPPESVKKQRNIFHPVILPYRYAKHNTYKAVSIQIIGIIMCGMVKEFWNILKPSSDLCYHGIIHTKKYRLCCQWIRYHSQSNFSCDIHKVGIINFCIGTCVEKGIEGFCGNPRQKVLI